ncbi:sigma-70 domain-containing protein [Nocardia sp. CA-128927]|uniref:sigma-70 domain-containing protein n=1 Tax=Nocardia sp. CA-128927 TaxID=3239975 RepID=UPI003D9737CF
MIGEIRHHLRDYTCTDPIQRRLEEIRQTIAPAIDTLTLRLGHIPTATEIAEELYVDLLEVTQALIARTGYQTSSIDSASGNHIAWH